MTLQEIADYAMDYLDSKGIAADYTINDNWVDLTVFEGGNINKKVSYKVVNVSFLDFDIELNLLHTERHVKLAIDNCLTNSK